MRSIPTNTGNATLLHTPAIVILNIIFAKMSEFIKLFSEQTKTFQRNLDF